MRAYLRIKRHSRNLGTAKQFGTGDVYRGRKLVGWFFIVEWEFKAECESITIPFTTKNGCAPVGLKSAIIHVFNEWGASISFYWNKDTGEYFDPVSNQSGADIHELVSRFVPRVAYETEKDFIDKSQDGISTIFERI